jgi:hypothetical protein
MAKRKTAKKSEVVEVKFDPADTVRLRMAVDVLEADVRLLRDQMTAVQAWQDVHLAFHFETKPWWRFWR